MTAYPRAAEPRVADLPIRSVVVDDGRGVVWYAHSGPGEDYRWHVTTGGDADSTVQYAIDHRGATVLRVGDGTETATETEVWAAKLTSPDGDTYQEAGDRKFAETIADSVATYLAEVAAGRRMADDGPDVTAAAVVRRIRLVFPDGSEHLSAWQHVRDGVPVED